MIIQMAVSRSREYQADASGAKLTRNPLGLASALGKLEQASRNGPDERQPVHRAPVHREPAVGRSLMSLFATHLPVQDRIARLRSMRF